jgi:hypothetical protein
MEKDRLELYNGGHSHPLHLEENKTHEDLDSSMAVSSKSKHQFLLNYKKRVLLS